MAGTLTATTIQNDTSSPPTFRNNSVEIGRLCRSWVNFSATSGIVVTNGSFNISSVTRTGTGRFTVSFTTAMPNANYSVIGMVKNTQTSGSRGAGGIQIADDNTPTASSFGVLTAYGATATTNGEAYDVEFAYLAVFSS